MPAVRIWSSCAGVWRLPFSKQQQLGKPSGGTRPTPSTITRPRPSLPDADLPFSKTKQMGKAPGSKTHPAR